MVKPVNPVIRFTVGRDIPGRATAVADALGAPNVNYVYAIAVGIGVRLLEYLFARPISAEPEASDALVRGLLEAVLRREGLKE